MATLADDVRDRAFERLYERHVRDVYRYVLVVLRNPADAEDVTQTTFLNAYRAFRRGERPLKPQNWLITIAHNACRTRAVRASRRPREVPLDDVVSQLAVPEQEKPSIRELLRALGRLPFNQRAALAMRELEGRSYEEIAETLDVSVPAVEALVARARRALRAQQAALRGLAAVPLPRSLRSLVEPETASTLVGGGLLAKAAAVLVAGVVAGGVGYTVEAGTAPKPAPAQLERRPPAAVPEPAARPAAARVVARTPTREQAAPVARPVALPPPPRPAVAVVASGGASAPVTPAAAAPVAAPEPAPPPAPTAPALVQTTAAALPLPEPALPELTLPELPPVAPAPPDLPQLPQLP